MKPNYQSNKKENNDMFDIIENFSTLERTKKCFKASFETFTVFRGGALICQKQLTISKNLEKLPKLSNQI